MVACVLGVEALLLVALFFIGPAMAVQANARSIFASIEDSFGSIPARGFRLCAAIALVLWISRVASVSAAPAVAWGNYIEHQPPKSELILIAALVLLFLFATGLQSVRTSARLAVFTNKLFIAVLIAAFIRVREGWAAVLYARPAEDLGPMVEQFYHGFSRTAVDVALFALLVADFTGQSHNRRQVVTKIVGGVALPLFGVLLLSEALGNAIITSRFMPGTSWPVIDHALFFQAAGAELPARFAVVVITMFGAARFAAKALVCGVPERPLGKRKWVVLGFVICGMALLSLFSGAESLRGVSAAAATCFAIASAVLTADFLMGRKPEKPRRFDCIGIIALMAGLSMSLYLSGDYVWGMDKWLMPSYALAFLVCLCGRFYQKLNVRQLA